ncbi:mitochondrial fission ELM1 family protein [Acetobacter sicerae]|uniref:Mitochondrial fission ELM1 family protein n=1 Tax=Acetobacter sicerae TaxID=85325 RepID=A0ABS8VSA1_9PROT|nr:ELM1/GtrOC1 family putative glycosyltransferase [Acetobacter sicerae]MCE0742848.1 mitochondrial fission ELM1 family protein [Acetobacter sicerae]
MTDRLVPSRVPVWVIESAQPGGCGPAHALAGRLGTSFRRLTDVSFVEDDSASPGLVLTAGFSAGMAGLSLRKKLKVPVVHCCSSRSVALAASRVFDEVILSSWHVPERESSRVFSVLGPLSIVSPALYERAERLWRERLEHLPRPRIAVRLEAGWSDSVSDAMLAARQIELSMRLFGGSLLVTIGEGVPAAFANAFVDGLGSCIKLIWRHGEPDDNPGLGFTACSDAVILYGTRVSALVEAAASVLPLFLGHVPGHFGGYNSLARVLLKRGNVRIFDSDFSPWPREVLDEAGRAACFVWNRFEL